MLIKLPNKDTIVLLSIEVCLALMIITSLFMWRANKKLTVLFRVEPGSLGPDGSEHVEEFCAKHALPYNSDPFFVCIADMLKSLYKEARRIPTKEVGEAA